ncbi:hypothetical protein C8J55DRAFT_510550 [Lentinula edodes]|uniref:Uncharacterized protein n=1 Tax=Lentinula lateritia TaxID=40482 RepID=A0A9W9AM79_9AGAR|nr:hypothetical protein C8J55DRAFT_510550 [Lentinula edodes]
MGRKWPGITPRSGAKYLPVVHTGSGTLVKLLATPFTHCYCPREYNGKDMISR